MLNLIIKTLVNQNNIDHQIYVILAKFNKVLLDLFMGLGFINLQYIKKFK